MNSTRLDAVAEPPARLTPVVFSTAGLAPRHQLDLWRSNYLSVNQLEPLDAAQPGFEARNEIWSFGRIALMRNSAPGIAFERTLRHARRDSVDHWVIRVARSGESRLRLGDRVFATRPGQPFLFSLDCPHRGDRSAADWVSIYLPRDSYPDLSAGLIALGPRLLDGPGAALLADYILMLERRMPTTGLAEVPMLAEATRAMVAACLLGDVAPRALDPATADLAQLERARCLIRRHIGSPRLGPERLCRLAGVSRSQLYRIFAPQGGVARYIQAQRMRLAHAMLADPACRDGIAAIAERVGHFDPSAFSRAFRQEFGYTPTEVRAATRGGGLKRPPAAAGAALPATDFGGLLRHLGTPPRAAA